MVKYLYLSGKKKLRGAGVSHVAYPQSAFTLRNMRKCSFLNKTVHKTLYW